MKNFEELLQVFIDNGIKHNQRIVQDQNGARRYNRYGKHCMETASLIDRFYPERKNDFMVLLHHENWNVRNLCAYAILTRLHYTPEDEKTALDALKKLANEANESLDYYLILEVMLLPLFLEDWHGEKNKTSTVYIREQRVRDGLPLRKGIDDW